MENLKYKRLRTFYTIVLFITSLVELAMGIVAITMANPPKVLNIIALVFACLFVLFVILNIVNNSKEIHFYKKQEEKE